MSKNMSKNIYVIKITFPETKDVAYLHYNDGVCVKVQYADYARALMTLVNSPRDEIIRDFAI